MTPTLAALTPWIPWLLTGFGLGFALALYFTPILRQAAQRFGIIDQPDGRLKTHRDPVAYLGGLAIYLAFLITLGLLLPFEQDVLGLLLAASLILLLGLIDDLEALSPAVKLLGQLLAAFVLIKAGIRIQIAALPVPVCDILTVGWVIGVTNAFNIIDVSDGLASGVSFVALVILALVAILNGEAERALFILALAGATLGFLRYNWAPASIYLGDAGSMFIGFLAGALAIMMSYGDRNPFGVVAPVLILGVPLFDLAFVMFHRARRGLPVMRGSPDHFAVRLRRAGVPARRIAFGACMSGAALGACGLLLVHLEAGSARWLLGGVVAAVLVAAVALSRVSPPARG